VAREKRPKLCNDVVLLNNRIQTKENNTFTEQSQLNSMWNYDVIRFCFDSEYAKEYWVSEEYKITNDLNTSHCMRSISSHVDIQSAFSANSVVFIARQQRSMLMRDIDIANLSVCPSVRNVPVSDENGLTYRHSLP